jgi:hypothetical protein
VHRVPNLKLLAVVGRNSSVSDFAAGKNPVSKLFTARALHPFEQIAGFKWMKKRAARRGPSRNNRALTLI